MPCVCCSLCCYASTISVQVSGFVGAATRWNSFDPAVRLRWNEESFTCPGEPTGGVIVPSTFGSFFDSHITMSLAELNGTWTLQQSTCGSWLLNKPALCPYVEYRYSPFGSLFSCAPKTGTVSVNLLRNANTNNFTLSGFVASAFLSANFSAVIACNQTIKNIPNTNPAQQQCCSSNDGPGLNISGSYTATMQGDFPFAPSFDKYPITMSIQ